MACFGRFYSQLLSLIYLDTWDILVLSYNWNIKFNSIQWLSTQIKLNYQHFQKAGTWFVYKLGFGRPASQTYSTFCAVRYLSMGIKLGRPQSLKLDFPTIRLPSFSSCTFFSMHLVAQLLGNVESEDGRWSFQTWMDVNSSSGCAKTGWPQTWFLEPSLSHFGSVAQRLERYFLPVVVQPESDRAVGERTTEDAADKQLKLSEYRKCEATYLDHYKALVCCQTLVVWGCFTCTSSPWDIRCGKRPYFKMLFVLFATTWKHLTSFQPTRLLQIVLSR